MKSYVNDQGMLMEPSRAKIGMDLMPYEVASAFEAVLVRAAAISAA
jgi:hypothetical protein